jgi:preprotein translocase subunit SecF
MLPNIYKGNYKLLALAPLALILLSLVFIPSIKLGVDFQGGTVITLTLQQPVDAQALQAQLQGDGIPATVRAFKTTVGYQAEIEVPQSPDLIKADSLRDQFDDLLPEVQQLEVQSYQNSTNTSEYQASKAELDGLADSMFALAGMQRSQLNISGTNDLQKSFTAAYNSVYSSYQKSISVPINKHIQYDSISVQTVSPALSTHFISTATNVVVLAVLLSLVLVFMFFRNIAPSIAVLMGALSDVVIAMGGMGILGVPLTLASFAALIMLVGFSLDTDILLTTRLLKRKGDPRENAFDAMKTGMTMSVMAIIAFLALFILSAYTHIPTYYEISAVALAGLVGDIFATWGINGVMMLHHVESRRSK